MRGGGRDAACDVLVVGGGPVGLAAAVELGRRGVSCAVLEPRREVSWARPRAKTTSARTMEHFRRWGLADELRRRAPIPVSWSQDAVFCTRLLGREITRIGHCFAMSPERSDLMAEGGQQVPQPVVEELLREAVGGLPTVSFLPGWRALTISEDDAGVLVEAAEDSGATASIAARYVIGADGARSVTRPAISAAYEGVTDERPNFNLVFSAPGLHARHRLGPAIHYWVLNPRLGGVLGPLDLGDRWWVIATGVDAEEGAKDPMRVVTELVGGPVEATVLSTDPWTAQMALADRYRHGRTYLAGDAAHLNPPWGGHGFNTGVGDAVNLAWKLAAVLAGWGGPRLLESYEAERRAVATETIAVAGANMAVLAPNLAGDDLEGDGPGAERRRRALAERIVATKSAEFHSLGLVLGYRYDDSPVVVADGTPPPPRELTTYTPTARPGARLPHRWLGARTSLYDALGEGFTLVRLDPGCDPGPLARAAALRGLPLVVRDGFFPELAGPIGTSALLVRPDQHVAWRGDPTTVDPLEIVDLVRGAPPEHRSRRARR